MERKANKYERYAARFAAKEAGMKAIGTGWRGGVTWQDFEVDEPGLRQADAGVPWRGGGGGGEARRHECGFIDDPYGGVGHGARDPGGVRLDAIARTPMTVRNREWLVTVAPGDRTRLPAYRGGVRDPIGGGKTRRLAYNGADDFPS